MKLISSLFVAVTLCLAPVSTSLAVDSTATPTPAAATTTSSKPSHTTGVITSIDATGMSFVAGKKTPYTYTVTSDTKILLVDKSAGTFADLKVGDHVTIYYPKTTETTRTAVKVTESPAPTPKPPKVSPTPKPAAAAQ